MIKCVLPWIGTRRRAFRRIPSASDIKASPSSFDTARVVEPFPLDPEYADSLPDAAWLFGDNCTLKGISASIGEHQSGKSGAPERLFLSKAG